MKGSRSVAPSQTTTYTLQAKGAGGETDTTVTVNLVRFREWESERSGLDGRSQPPDSGSSERYSGRGRVTSYDASNIAIKLYDSSANPADQPGYGIKFTSPIVVNGKVFIGTAHDPLSSPNPQGELDVYGLRP